MTPKERVIASLNHDQPDTLAVDFGSNAVTGIHVKVIEGLRSYYGLEEKPVKVIEPYQMLGEVDEELMEIMGVDIVGISPKNNMFGFDNNSEFKEFKTFWGQELLVPKDFNTTIDSNGDLLMYPGGDTSVAPSAKMPSSGFFFDAIIRQEPIDDLNLNVEDNLEEFQLITNEELKYWKEEVEKIENTNKAVIANFGGTALGDIALVPAMGLKHPKGIRDVSEWYMSTVMRPDYIHEIFEKQSDIAIKNLERLFEAVGNRVDVLFMCGTDFGTQDSQFCSPDDFDGLYFPYYKKMNDWIHKNTTWKTFKHSCGAVEPLIPNLIEAGFDIVNPIQINAAGMDSKLLKEKYGDDLTFWGGGVDTQNVLPFGTPEDVKKQVEQQCRILNQRGGFVFNTVHNIQANCPIENIVAMIETIRKIKNL